MAVVRLCCFAAMYITVVSLSMAFRYPPPIDTISFSRDCRDVLNVRESVIAVDAVIPFELLPFFE